MNMIKVSSSSHTSAVAGAIAGVVREHQRAEGDESAHPGNGIS